MPEEVDMSTENPLQSRKFVAYLVAEITWKILAILVLFWGRDSIPQQVWVILMSVIIVAGFIEAVYIGGQAALDKYIQVAKIASLNGKALIGKTPEPDKAVKKDPLSETTD